MAFKRVSLPLFLMMLFLFLFVSSVSAVEVPPPGVPTYVQTNGAGNPINNGDWYSANTNGQGGGFNYFTINVPPDWPGTAIQIDLFSPEMNSTNPTSDEVLTTADSTQFELYPPGTVVGPLPNVPNAGGGIAGSQITYAPSAAAEQWVRYFTITTPTPGIYVLRAATLTDDQNGWRLRVGTDNDADPNNAPPANSDNPDGVLGTNDELTIGVIQGTYQHNITTAGVGQCLTLFEYVPPVQPSIIFHNFDMDGNQRVTYYAPSDTFDPTGATVGTSDTAISGNGVWNGGTQTTRGGFTISTPESGWWRIVSCVDNNNQYIQEAQTGVQAFYQQPPTPQMTLSKDDGLTTVSNGQQITYTITFTNTSSGATAGAANNVVLVDTLPTNTTFVSAAFGPGFTGSIVSPPVGGTGTVTFNVSGAVNAGATGTATVTVDVTGSAGQQVINNVDLNYQDGFGNPFLPPGAGDTDDIVEAPGSVSGVVFNDINGNGVQDGGELGIPNITVTVTGPSGPFTLTTDGNGNYSQTGLTPGSYDIAVDASDPDLGGATPTTATTANVTVPSGGNASANFGFQAPIVPGSVSGTVFNDTNGNGTQDGGELGIPNVTVTITGPSGPFTLTTDGNGNYSQAQLTPGSYTVDVDSNDPDIPAGATLTTGNDPATVAVPPDGNATANFGFGTPQPGSINGTVFNDTNGNGVQDGGEAGIANISVTITGPGGPFTLTTDANGNYSQTGLTPGSYSVDVDTADPDLPAGAVLTTANDPAAVTVPAGGTGSANFGFRAVAPGSISGNMFNDANGNGVRDPGEAGVGGVTVILTGTDSGGNPVSLTTTTDANGNYLFTGLEAGTYTVTAPPQAGYTFTTPGAVTVTLPANGTGVANFGIVTGGTTVAVQPTLSLVDPFITKSVNPPFALRDETVTWTITVTNPGSVPATNVNVSDNLPNQVAIQSVRSTSGTASFSGQRVTFTQPTLGAGQSVTITVVTRVRDDASLPFTITNVATLTNAENPTPRTAQATVVSAGTLPETGEVSVTSWRFVLVVLVSTAAMYFSFRWLKSR